MGLVNYTDEHSYDRKYNVEYELGNGRLGTFSNILRNIDNKYFWFDSSEYGMDIIKQDRIVTMVCERNKTL